jgi:mono/diheme cytochrome c family protein
MGNISHAALLADLKGKEDNHRNLGWTMPTMRKLSTMALSLTLSISGATMASRAEVLSPAAQRGLVFVRVHCSQCHAIARIGASSLPIAPPFRTLHNKYPVESLEESLGEGIVTGHPSMPEFRLDPGQINDVISYLKTLE